MKAAEANDDNSEDTGSGVALQGPGNDVMIHLSEPPSSTTSHVPDTEKRTEIMEVNSRATLRHGFIMPSGLSLSNSSLPCEAPRPPPSSHC